MNIIFFGSDDFAAAHLEKILSSAHKVVACVTQPDRPQGRGMKVIVSPIKSLAEKNHIPILQPAKLKDAKLIDDLRAFHADCFVVIAYGRILTPEILALPLKTAINVHGSLLPRYRGAAPIQWAVINGETETGLSIIRMSPELDAGDVLSQHKMVIRSEDTAATLRERMKKEGPVLLLSALEDISEGKITPVRQEARLVTQAPKITKETGEIRWDLPAGKIRDLVRGLLPWPTAYTFYQGKLLKILSADVMKGKPVATSPGVILEIVKEGFIVSTGKEVLLVRQVHPESGKEMDAASFARGHRMKIGDRLGK